MLRFVTRKWSITDVLDLFDPLIGEWFSSRYDDLTEPQAYAIPLIHSGKNVLVSSPTGSGKTMTAFISIINELFLMSKSGELENQIYCVYISPLKALANDIHRNLEVPLAEIMELAKREKIKVPKVRVGVRSGDTPQSERQKMLRKPPHILITTPESLALMLTAPKFREKFRTVRYVIVDEIHELASNKRGVLLSLNLERLAHYAGEFQRIGLSATQAPIEEIARYLVGLKDGKERDAWIVQPKIKKDLDLKVITPVEDLTMVPYEVATEKMYDILVNIINEHRTTLIFTNTRSGAEHVAYKLKERGIESIEAHHGSLSKETRLSVEKDLKEGKLKCVISSTSLELGIDIGYIDVVVQIGSPKSVAKALQRIGRSGHAYGRIAKGRFVVFELDDLIECTTLVKCAYEGNIDRIRIPENSLDVLAQVIVGMSLEQRWNVDDAYSLIKNSYCYRNLPRGKFMEVLRYLGGKVLGNEFYSKIWFDEDEGVFGKKRSARMIYFMNIGTIPDESDYLAVDVEGKRLGSLSEKFVEKLQRGDVFVLGAKSYEVVKITSSRVVVRAVTGKRPTVPSWVGEMLPRSFDLSVEVGRFRELVKEKIEKSGEDGAIEFLTREYYLDSAGARSIVSYVKEQMHYAVPTHRDLVVEGYIDPGKKHNLVFHFPFGRRVNDALSRAYAHAITEKYHTNVGVSITDDAFMLTAKRKIPLHGIVHLINSENLESTLRDAIFNTEMFKQRFRHVATRSFMVLRRYKGRSISVARQQLRSDKILRLLLDIPGFPVMEETFNEIMNIAMDLPSARKVLEGLENGEIKVSVVDYSTTPSVFAHSIILVGISDIVLMEDRSALLKELHIKLLEKIIPDSEISAMFTEDYVMEHFRAKCVIDDRESMEQFFRNAPGAGILHRRGVNIYDYSELSDEETLKIAESLIADGTVVSVYGTRLLWAHSSLYPAFSTLYAKECESKIDWDDDKSVEEIAKLVKKKKSEVVEILKCMERAYLTGRTLKDGKFLWHRTEPERMARDYAIELILRNLLYFRAPLTFEEIVYSLRVPEDDVRRILKYMVDEGTVVKGKFMVGYGEQYMLAEDFRTLVKKSGISSEDLWRFRSEKILGRMSVDDYFSRFMVLFNPESVRVRGFYDEFMDLVKRGEIAYGRFMGGRLCYAPKHLIPIFAGVYRSEELDEKDRRILNLIGALGEEATSKKIQKYSNYPAREVRKILQKLERNIYIYRSADMHMNPEEFRYEAIIHEATGSVGDFLRKILAGYGPLSRDEIEWLTGLNVDGEFSKVVVEGKEYLMTEEKIPEKKGVSAIVPREDPLTYPFLQGLYSRFENVLSFIYIDYGIPVSTGEVSVRGDHYNIDEVIGNVEGFFTEICKMRPTITHINPKTKKYRKVGNFYVCGSLSDKIYSKDKVISYLLWKSHLVAGRKLKTPLDVVRFILSAHSEREMQRSLRKIELTKYYHSNLIYETLDLRGDAVYATLDNIALFQKIRNLSLDANMEVVLKIFKEGHALRTAEILHESPLGVERTRQALTALYRGNYLARTSSGYQLVVADMPYEYAVEKFIEKLHNMIGFLSVDIIREFSGGHIPVDEISRVLNLLNLSRGLYLNDGYIYYTNETELENAPNVRDTLILDQKDPIAIVLRKMFPQKFDGYIVIFEGRVESVKAKGKRKIKVLKATSPDAEREFLKYFTP